jgi:alkaline phosphatase
VDQYFDDRARTGLRVLMGGGRKWFLPNTVPGSARSIANDYVLPADLVARWGVAPGALDPTRDLLAEFQAAGFYYAPDATTLAATPPTETRILGLFALSNMNVAKDKIDGRRAASTVVDDYGFPDQPMLDEMTQKALKALNQNNDHGFVLMVEGASIDKQAHNMDSERWILDTIELDRAVAVARDFAAARSDTLLIVTADHECAGANLIGRSRVTHSDLETRSTSGGGAASLRDPVVGGAGFPIYTMGDDGFPATTDIDYRLLIGYAANADRNEDWITNPQPLRDGQQPYNNQAPLNTYPGSPTARDTAGAFFVRGQVPGSAADHTGSDIPLSALGAGSQAFTGVMDNTDVFFKVLMAVR